MRPLGIQADGKFLLNIAGTAGLTFRVQASTDHKNWTDLGTVTLTEANGIFVDPNPAQALRFYRAVLVP